MQCAICSQALWLIYLLIYVLIVNIIIGKVIERLKEKKKDGVDETTRREAVGWLGYFEILSYSLLVFLGYPQFIAVWIGIRTLERWRADVKKKELIPPGSINIFLTGTLASVIAGVLGGIIFIKLGETMFMKQFIHIF